METQNHLNKNEMLFVDKRLKAVLFDLAIFGFKIFVKDYPHISVSVLLFV